MPATERAAPAAPIAECIHCGLPVPSGRADPAAGANFCCSGCSTAYAILHEHGLDHYYRLSARRGARVESRGRSYAEFDHPAFHARYVTRDERGICATSLHLDGVHCASCLWLIERVPLAVPGTRRAELDVPRGRVRLEWDAGRTKLSTIARFLDVLGYAPRPWRGLAADARHRDEDRRLLIRIGIAGAIALNVMTLALALYSGTFSGMEHEYERYFRWLSLALATPALLGPGLVFFRSAWGALRARALHMDLPIALALGAGYVRGAANTLADRGPIYFDGVTALIFLLLVGRFMQRRAQRAAADSAELMYALSPSTARVFEEGAVREVPSEALLPGMMLEVRGGDTLAADGVVVEGRSEIDTSLLTGESRPRTVTPGTPVFAGSVNRSARILVRVEQTGEASRVGRILREVERGARRRAPIVRTADRLAGGFVAAVLALAALTFVAARGAGSSAALDRAIALLIVTCPCALALATPLAMTVAIGRAARTGILVKSADALEVLARPSTLVLDKTGTLTEGRTTLAAWDGPEWVAPLVVALERHATHPVAAGFLAAWSGAPRREAEGVRHAIGGGVEGVVDGRRVVVGSPGFVSARTARDATAHADPADSMDGHLTPVWVAVDGAIVGRATFTDPIRPDTAPTLARLRAMGFRTRLLSGDHPAVASEVGRALGFSPADCRGGASPEDKAHIIAEHSARGPTLMVGDGVNDAAAMARAAVGVGVHGGAEACLAAADVFLAAPGLGSLVALVEGARRTMGTIRVAIGFSLIYNVIGATLAMTGAISPVVAAIMMPVSSLTVVLVAWRGRTFDPPQAERDAASQRGNATRAASVATVETTGAPNAAPDATVIHDRAPSLGGQAA